MQYWKFLTLSTTDWDAPQFGSRQQIALQLVQRGHQVLFVEIPRALHSFVSDPTGMKRAMGRLGQVRQIEDGPLVYTPWPILPIYYNPLINHINQWLLRRDLKAILTKLGWRPDILWSYWPNTAPLFGTLGERLAVYHCIDDFAAVGYFLTPKQAIQAMEAEQCRRADVIFTRTQGLTEAKRQINPHTVLLPGGVDTTVFDPTHLDPPRPDIAALPSPRVGFVGTIDDRVDVPLLVYCASRLSQATFVFVGPIKRHRVDVTPLEQLPNVYFLPPCSFNEVPAIMATFAVGLIPYVINPYTRGLSPIKLYEYLALGQAVVGTPLPYLQREADHIALADTPEAFWAAIQHHLSQSATTTERDQRRQVAEKYAWAGQVDQIEAQLAVLLQRV